MLASWALASLGYHVPTHFILPSAARARRVSSQGRRAAPHFCRRAAGMFVMARVFWLLPTRM